MKRTPLKRKTPLKATSSLKRTARKTVPRRKADKLPKASTIQKKCDALLTPIIKLMYPTCVLTGEPTEVAHHAIKKSTSSALRYYLPNLVPLTHKAHLRLHCDEITWTGRLIAIKGMEWWEDLERERRKPIKTDVHYYLAELERLQAIYDDLRHAT